jgi:hypothetical protein
LLRYDSSFEHGWQAHVVYERESRSEDPLYRVFKEFICRGMEHPRALESRGLLLTIPARTVSSVDAKACGATYHLVRDPILALERS